MDNKIFEYRNAWRQNWLSQLFLFAHLKYQEDLWIKNIYPKSIGWFEEDICRYFDDLNIEDHYLTQLKHGLISEDEYNVTKDFHFALEIFLKIHENKLETLKISQLLQDKEWIKVSNLANQTWSKLLLICEDIEEKSNMEILMNKYL